MQSESIRAVGVAILLVSLVADQILKSWAHAAVSVTGVIPVVPGFNIVAIDNSGVAFGLAGGSAPWVLILIGLVLSGWLFLWLMRTRSMLHAIGLGLAVGGALGNVMDRLLLGAVRDYIDIHWNNLHWPAFNLADVAIVSGLAIVVLFQEKASGEGNRRRPSSARIEPVPARQEHR